MYKSQKHTKRKLRKCLTTYVLFKFQRYAIIIEKRVFSRRYLTKTASRLLPSRKYSTRVWSI